MGQTGSKEVQTIMEEVPRRLEGTGIVTGTTLTEPDDVRQKIDWGLPLPERGHPPLLRRCRW